MAFPHPVQPLREFTIDRLRVQVWPDRASMGRAAGLAAIAAIEAALAQQATARVILASAPSQLETLETLTAAAIDWSRVTLFHMDEYVGLPATHPATFRSFQKRVVLSRIAPRMFHGICGEADDLKAECDRYAALLAEAPIDLVCLGIGENGHLAFNDPPVAHFDDPLAVKVVKLDDLCRRQQVNDGCFETLANVPARALTLTIPALTNAGRLIVSVPGTRKAPAVHQTLNGPIATACPASILRRFGNATLYLDLDAFGEPEGE